MDSYETVLKARLDYVEAQLERLFPNDYVTYTSAMGAGVPAEVVELVRQNKKIAAIKAYRDVTGAGLKEAKELIDSL